MSLQTARALGFAAIVLALVQLLVFFRGIPGGLEAVLGAVPPFVAIALLYLPGPILGLIAFTVWTRLGSDERRHARWVPTAAAVCMFAAMVVPLLYLVAGLIGAALGR